MTELEQKLTRIRALLAMRQLDALLLRRVSSFAWATCGGDSHINTADSHGIASLLITPEARYLITTNIEAPRLDREEALVEQGWTFRPAPWFEMNPAIDELSRGLRLGADSPYPGAVDLGEDMARVRAALTPEEGQRLRKLSRECGDAIRDAAYAVRPGQSEHQIGALMIYETERRGVQVVVNLIATDERIYDFRHPIPTGKKLDRYAMLILCGRRQGLICSVTRFVHFGPIPDALRQKSEAVAQVDGAIIAATRPGRALGDIFRRAMAAYARAGVPDEWRLHHQGGLAGYEPREITATPDTTDLVAEGQAYAWNPSINGAKSEDTILVGRDGNEVLTASTGWPAWPVSVEGQTIQRPAILEVT
jgi:antitoxin VapB